jgi:multicomponent Na+:H+ antiporter subunit D
VSLSILPILAILSSTFAVIPILLAGSKYPNIREGVSFFAGLIKLLFIAAMVPAILGGTTIHCHILDLLPGLSISFKVDAFGLFFAAIASSLWIVTTVYSVGYMRKN